MREVAVQVGKHLLWPQHFSGTLSEKHGETVRVTKTVIRDPATGLYRADGGAWVTELAEAEQFSDINEAVRTCVRGKLLSYQVVMKHPTDEFYDTIVLEQRATKKEDDTRR